jgi:DNA helicase-2/ATP-dependent DNA helicase PcrA
MTQTDATKIVPTPEQQAIYDEFRSGTGHVVVKALAGVGKTTTAVTGVQFAPERNILFTCFNVKIRDAGNAKLKSLGITNAKFQNLHSIGMQTVGRFWEGVRVGENFERQTNLTNAVCGGTAPDAVKRLVSKLHTQAREMAPHATQASELIDIATQFECAPDDNWEAQGFGLNYVCQKAVEAMAIACASKPADGFIDFSDMIFLPVRNGWLAKTYDMVIVDEAQDLTVAKLEIAQGVCRGRLFIFGDSNQAIYGFAGADTESLGRLERVLNAKVLTLTKTFRCGKAIVAEAQRYVPDFVADEGNCDGAVETLAFEKLVDAAGPSNYILSRMNAPLVSVAMRLLRNGKRTRIVGKDIGKGLVALVRKLRATSVPDFLRKLSAWADREEKRLTARYAGKLESPAYTTRLDAVRDQHDMLANLADGAKSIDQITTRVEDLFVDVNGLGDEGVITCSSVHKAKGLEAKKVFVLADTLRNDDQEEKNIAYVAITRAIEVLVYVSGGVRQ